MSNTVKYFHSGLAGAPALNDTAGSLIGVLDACLVNGWGSGSVDSIVIASGVATVTRGAGHPFEPDMVVEIAGATVTGGTINGQFKVSTAVGNTYTFPVPGLPNQTATGTITHKIAALGFTKPYTGTNLAAYRSSDITGTQFYLHVDDTNSTLARVRGFETMSSISDASGNQFPTEAQQSGGLYATKTISGSAPWELFGNGKTFYLCAAWGGTGRGVILSFGDLNRTGSSDAYATFIHALTLSGGGTNSSGSTTQSLDYSSTAAGVYSPRPWSGLGTPVEVGRTYPTFINVSSGYRSGDTASNHVPYPNNSNNGLYVAPWFASESVSATLRGSFPGFFALPQRIGSSVFSQRQKVSAISGLPDRKLMVLNSASGCFAFDVTGPWQ